MWELSCVNREMGTEKSLIHISVGPVLPSFCLSVKGDSRGFLPLLFMGCRSWELLKVTCLSAFLQTRV